MHDIFPIPENVPYIGGVYAHYKDKNKEYLVTGISLNSDSDEWHVEYVPLYEGAVAQKFNRSLASWISHALVDEKEMTRYSFVRMQ